MSNEKMRERSGFSTADLKLSHLSVCLGVKAALIFVLI